MDFCNCSDIWPTDEPLFSLERALYVIIVMAYFVITLKFFCHIRSSPNFPCIWVFVYFGIVAAICGANYMTNLWMYSQYALNVAKTIETLKVCVSAVIWLIVVAVIYIISDILSLRKEQLLKNRVDELSRKTSHDHCQAETAISFRKLTHEIRSTLDGHHIVQATIVGLGRILDLEECTLWFPSQVKKNLQLSYTFNHSISIGFSVSMSLPVVTEIFDSVEAVRISHTCPLVRVTPIDRRCAVSEVVAIRVPLLHLSSNEPKMSYAVIVLVLPSDSNRKFREDELELVRGVAEEVSVALAHASDIEESAMACDHLLKENSSIKLALKDMEMTLHASNVSWIGMFHQMLTPVHAIHNLSSLLLETTLTGQQRAMAETLFRSSCTTQTLMQNEADLSGLEDGSLKFNISDFNLSATINQVVNNMNPIAAVKNLSLSLVVAPNLPVYVIGDQERLMQIILNVVSNAVKFTKEGHIAVTASVATPKSFRHWRPRFSMVSSEAHFYLTIQVQDSGCGIDPQEIPKVFNQLTNSESTSSQPSSGRRGLAFCKRLLHLMDGRIRVESEGLGKGTTVIFVVILGIRRNRV